jgi:hypothetical protein
MGDLWRIMLDAEDGVYCIEDGFPNQQAALARAKYLTGRYGEGQRLYVESY